jgi:hypothetical protein
MRTDGEIKDLDVIYRCCYFCNKDSINCWFCFYLFCSLWRVSYNVVAPHQSPSAKWLYTLLTVLPTSTRDCEVQSSYRETLHTVSEFLHGYYSSLVSCSLALRTQGWWIRTPLWAWLYFSVVAYFSAGLSCDAGSLALDRTRTKEFTEMSHVPGLITNRRSQIS